MGGERNVLRVLPWSWLKLASFRQRSIAVRALLSSLMIMGNSSVPPDARFDVAVGFVGGHEYFVRIVLPEAREVHQQAMHVRHRQFDLVNLRDAFENSLAHRIQRVLHGLAFVRRKYREQHL